MQSVRFFDVSEGNVQNTLKEGKRVTFGAFSTPGPTRKLRAKVTSSPERAAVQGKGFNIIYERILVKLVR